MTLKLLLLKCNEQKWLSGKASMLLPSSGKERHWCVVVVIFGDVCTHGILYSVGQVARPGDSLGGTQKAKSAKITENTGLCHPY